MIPPEIDSTLLRLANRTFPSISLKNHPEDPDKKLPNSQRKSRVLNLSRSSDKPESTKDTRARERRKLESKPKRTLKKARNDQVWLSSYLWIFQLTNDLNKYNIFICLLEYTYFFFSYSF